MKQRITLKQFEELEGESKRKFCEWVESKWTADSYIYPRLTKDDYLVSIGQLIEFLININVADYIDDFDYEHCIIGGDFNKRLELGWDGELCDRLWQEVKNKLKS